MKEIVRPKNLRSLRRDERAVSPVVATLMLILVAVGAAAALYLWLSGWQSGVTKSVGNPNAQYSLTIGGSTTVFPLSEMAIKWFEQNNSNVVIADNQGGSGAGLLGLCFGHVDIAANSRPITSGDLTVCPALSGADQTVIGYDAVVALVPLANAHGIVSISSQAMLMAYWLNGGQPTLANGFPTTFTNTAGSLLTPANWGIQAPTGPAGPLGNTLLWSNFPTHACYDSAVPAPNIGAPVAYGTQSLSFFVPGGYVGPCAASWAAAAGATSIHVYGRQDNGGTSEAFDNNMLNIKCGTDQQLSSCGFPYNPGAPSVVAVNVATGNFAVQAAVAKDPDSLGYSSWGEAQTAGTLTLLPFQGSGQAVSGADKSVPVSLGNIKAGIAAGYGNQVAGGYVGWRPLEYTTMGKPSGESLRYIEFVTQPGNNNLLCTINHFISVYA